MTDAWVDGYRGLFGLDTHDRFGGERSPAGPKYNRNGTQRLAWHDPLGFAGLDKEAPPVRWPAVLEEQEAALQVQRADVDARIAAAVERLPGLALEVQALEVDGGMEKLHAVRATELTAGELELRGPAHGGRRARRPAVRRAPRAGARRARATWVIRGRTCCTRTARCRRRTPSTASSWSSGRRSA